MIAIAFVHNLLRRHPACTVLLHQPLPQALGHADADPAARQAGRAANGQAAGQLSLSNEHGQSKHQGPLRPEEGGGPALEQSAEGVSEANSKVQHKAGANDGHTSEQVSSPHLYLGLCSSLECQQGPAAGSPAVMLTLEHCCRTY